MGIFLGCSGSRDQDVLVMNLGAEPSKLNPVLYTDNASGGVVGLVFNGLLRVNSEMEMVPDLAKSYSISRDGRIYTFKLREDVTWHDGERFDAEDVIFTFETILDTRTNTVRRSNFVIEGEPAQFHMVDEFTVQVLLPQPFAPFPIHMSMGILPEHLLKDQDINTAGFNSAPVGTGPFRFREWQAGQYVYLDRYDGYYGKLSGLSGVLLKIIPDPNTALVALLKGELDLESGIQAKDFSRVQKKKGIETYRYYQMSYTYLGFNLKKWPFSELWFRQAVSHGINRPALVKNVLGEFGTEALMPASPVQWSYPENFELPYPYDVAHARKLIGDQGFVLNEDGIFERDGSTLSFRILTNKGNKNREKAAQIIQQYLKDIGIGVDIQVMEWSSFLKVFHGPEKAFEAVISGWGLGLDPDGFVFWHSSQFPDGFNSVGYSNAKVDRLLLEGRRELDRSRRKVIYEGVYREITRDAPYVFLYHGENLAGAHSRVKGLVEKPGAMGIIDEIEDVYIGE